MREKAAAVERLRANANDDDYSLINEGEASRTTCHAVLHDVNGNHHARLREMILQVVFRCGEG